MICANHQEQSHKSHGRRRGSPLSIISIHHNTTHAQSTISSRALKLQKIQVLATSSNQATWTNQTTETNDAENEVATGKALQQKCQKYQVCTPTSSTSITKHIYKTKMHNKKTTKINWNLKSEKEGRCYDMAIWSPFKHCNGHVHLNLHLCFNRHFTVSTDITIKVLNTQYANWHIL